jgi:DNA modification methylase
MKPVGLVAQMLRNSAPLGAAVLDPFGGSGSTLMACDALGLRARLVELDARYVDVIVRRWQDTTGRSATLAGAETFGDVAVQRGESE